MHLNLVRSCETPSDPTRCQLPPWVPSRLQAGSRALARPVAACAVPVAAVGCLESERVPAAAISFVSHRKPSLVLASSRTLYGFRVSCCTSLSFVQCFTVYQILCTLSSPIFRLFNALQCSTFRSALSSLATLLGICIFCLAPRKPSRASRCASLILSHPMRLSCFVLCLAFCVSMLRSVAHPLRLCQVILCLSVLCWVACAVLHSVELPAIDRPGLYPCSAAFAL